MSIGTDQVLLFAYNLQNELCVKCGLEIWGNMPYNIVRKQEQTNRRKRKERSKEKKLQKEESSFERKTRKNKILREDGKENEF